MFTRKFKDIFKGDANIAGGKGASLGEMISSKIPVPDGFVILSTTFEKFIMDSGLDKKIEEILKKVNQKKLTSVNSASSKIEKLIIGTEISKDIKNEINKGFKELKSKFVAVRSSATCEDSSSDAWAGQLETYLNITEKTLFVNIKNCWASLFTPRAIVYRFEKGLNKTKISVAVVIQKMVQSDVAGVAFTVHPVTKNKNQMIIEAGYGLGEAVVSGSITPDSYIIDKKDFSIIDMNIANQERKIVQKSRAGGTSWMKVLNSDREKQKLTGSQIKELAKICLNIEKHYKFPCDIEWALEKGKFYITQSRPITTL